MESRTDKNTRLLMLYDALLNGNGVDKNAFSMEHGINERSFDRDIEDIRLFLSESYSGEDLYFDRRDNSYFLSGSRPKYMDRMEAVVISKIILESGLLRKDEMCGLLESVLASVAPRDAKIIEEHLLRDIQNYESGTEVAILKFVEDLYDVLKSGRDVKVFVKDGENTRTERISPLEIVCEKSVFQLVAARNCSITDIVKIDIRNIVKFETLFSDYARRLKEKYYEEQEGYNYGKGCKTIKNE